MNLHLHPKQFITLYNCIKKYEIDVYDDEELDIVRDIRETLENAIIGAFESLESRALATGFDRWVKSEKNKIEGLENELEKIKGSIHKEELVEKFVPVVKDKKTAGRPKKSR